MSDILMTRPLLLDMRDVPEPPELPDRPRIVWERIGAERYEVLVDWTTTGFVDVVGSVFVALIGTRYARAVEIAQSLSFEGAVEAVAASASNATWQRIAADEKTG